MQHRLVIDDLACGFHPSQPVVQRVSFTLGGSETAVVVGPSGCGKSTLLKTLAGLQRPLAGRASVLGAELPDRPAAGEVGYIPQGLGLVRHVSVLKNVLMGSLPHLSLWRSVTGSFAPPAVARAHRALSALGLAHKAKDKPIHLSGGERRRVAIARALVQRPRLLLADEILSELDEGTQHTVLDAVRLLQAETGMTVLMVEHDLEMAWAVGDQIVALGDGGVAARFRPREDGVEGFTEASAVAR